MIMRMRIRIVLKLNNISNVINNNIFLDKFNITIDIHCIS
jgi:hypothetical protein